MSMEKYVLCLGGLRHFEVEWLINTFAFSEERIISKDALMWA